jgi:hypothetical protein
VLDAGHHRGGKDEEEEEEEEMTAEDMEASIVCLTKGTFCGGFDCFD